MPGKHNRRRDVLGSPYDKSISRELAGRFLKKRSKSKKSKKRRTMWSRDY